MTVAETSTTAVYRANFSEARPIDVNERGEFFALALDDGRFVKVSSDVKRIIECLVETAPPIDVDEIAQRLRREEVAELEPEQIEELIHSVLLPQEIIVEAGGEQPRGISAKGSRLWFHLKLFDGRSLGPVARKLAFLFTARAAWAAGLLWILANGCLVLEGAPRVLLSSESYRFGLVEFLALILPALLIHELGHAFSCFHFGVRAREMGVGLYLFRPVVYTDMSEAWLLSKRERIFTDLAGCYFSWLYIVVLTVVATVARNPVLLWALVLLYINMLVNLNPLLRFDGYWVLTDWAGVVNVHRRALALLGYHVWKMLGRDPPRPDLPVLSPRIRRILVGLSFLYLAFTLAFLYLGVRTLGGIFVDPGQRQAFLTPFVGAVRALDPVRFLDALRSGGLVSVMVFYLLLLLVSTVASLGSQAVRRVHRRSSRAPAGG